MRVCRGVINISYNANQFNSPGVSLMYLQGIHFFPPKNTAVSHYHILPYQPLTCVVKRRSIWCWNRPSEALSWNYQTLHDPCTQTVSRLKTTVYPDLGFSLSVGVLRNTGPLMRKSLKGSVSCRSPWYLAEVRSIVWKQTLTFNNLFRDNNDFVRSFVHLKKILIINSF